VNKWWTNKQRQRTWTVNIKDLFKHGDENMWMKEPMNEGSKRERNQEEKPREKRKPRNEGFTTMGV